MQKVKIAGMDGSKLCLALTNMASRTSASGMEEIILRALEAGVNFFDTSLTDALGAPSLSGRAAGTAAARGREKIVIAAKVGVGMREAALTLRDRIDKSLSDIGTDYIDIYFLDRCDAALPVERSLEDVGNALSSGKILTYGVNNYSVRELTGAVTKAKTMGLPAPALCQTPMNILHQDEFCDVLPVCMNNSIGILACRVFHGGVLTKDYEKAGMSSGAGHRADESLDIAHRDEFSDKLYDIARSAEHEGLSMAQYCLKWALTQPSVISAAVGVRDWGQLRELTEVFE